MSSSEKSAGTLIRGHLVFTVLALAFCGLFVLRGTFGGMAADEAGWAAAGMAGLAAVAHVLLAVCHPRWLKPRQGVALLLASASPLAFLLPVLVRPDGGRPVNPGKGPRADGRVHSRVVATGDTVSMGWSADDLKSVGAMWRGTPRVQVLNANELGCPPELAAKGRNDSWDSVIWTKGGYDSLSPYLTAEFRIPADDSLVGKSLQLRTTLSFEFPSPEGRTSYLDQSTMVTRFDNVMVASASVKQSYWKSWSRGATLGMLGTIVGGLLLVIFACDPQASTPSLPYSGADNPWRVQSAAPLR